MPPLCDLGLVGFMCLLTGILLSAFSLMITSLNYTLSPRERDAKGSDCSARK